MARKLRFLFLFTGLTSGMSQLEIRVRVHFAILLKNPMNASTTLSTNGKSPIISHAPPFVLRLSKDERKVFQQNLMLCLTPAMPLRPHAQCWSSKQLTMTSDLTDIAADFTRRNLRGPA